jgi:3-isopropylmalate/(R)-2-methylmalate dehydratase small subunit
MKAYVISGRAIVLGDDITTDAIIAGKHCRMADPERLAPHALEGVVVNFAGKVKRAGAGKGNGSLGAIIVAGKNFGVGSSREQAPLALLGAGVKAVVARSFGRIFFRNAVNLGLPVLKCPRAASVIRDGQTVTVDLAGGLLRCGGEGRVLPGERLPLFMMGILDDGGLVPHIKRRLMDGKA